ncbi:MAG TPA: hypothetical protein VFE36_16295 [Candidatus Baltobacteraceae bacterium]|nr:hypothetical protein [Candidatus Baltobacteraceae bacterium]
MSAAIRTKQVSLTNPQVNAIVTVVPPEILLAQADETDRELAWVLAFSRGPCAVGKRGRNRVIMRGPRRIFGL